MQPTTSSPITMSPISNYQDLSNLSTANQATAAPTAPASSSGGGGLLSRLLPSLGSIGGFLLAGALAPETGGLSLLAPILGSGLGEAAGKAAEDVTSGQSPTSGVLSDLAGGAAGGALGVGIGGLLGKTADLVGGAGERLGAKEAATTAASDIEGATAKNSANYAALTPKVQQNLNFGTNQDMFKGLGVDTTDPQALNAAAKGGLEMNGVVDNALTQSKPIDLTDMNNDLVNMAQTTPGDNLGGLITPEGQLATETVSGPDARTLAQTVNAQMRDITARMNSADLAGNVAGSDALQAQYDALKPIYDKLQDKMFTSNPEVDNAIASTNVDDTQRAGLVAKYGEGVGNHIADTINNAKTGKALTAAMRPFAETNDATKMAIDFNNNVTAGTAAKAQAKLAANQLREEAGVNEVANPNVSQAVEHLANGRKTSAATTLLKGAVTPKNASRLSTLLTAASKVAPVAAVGASTLGNLAPQSTPGMTNTAYTAGTGASAMNPQATTPVENDVNALLAQSILAPGPYGASAGSSLNTLLPLAQKQQQAQSLINTLGSQFGAAGGGQGFGGGLLTRLSALVPGSAASAYMQQQSATAAALAQLLGITPGAASSLTPNFMQTPQLAQQRLAGLSGLMTGPQTAGPQFSLSGL